jgi:hypothetical protein
MAPGLTDQQEEVKLTAAAAIAQLSALRMDSIDARNGNFCRKCQSP